MSAVLGAPRSYRYRGLFTGFGRNVSPHLLEATGAGSRTLRSPPADLPATAEDPLRPLPDCRAFRHPIGCLPQPLVQPNRASPRRTGHDVAPGSARFDDRARIHRVCEETEPGFIIQSRTEQTAYPLNPALARVLELKELVWISASRHRGGPHGRSHKCVIGGSHG